MHVAFAGRLVPPVTGAELVPLRILRELVECDKRNEYTIFVSAGDEGIIDFSGENLTIRTYDAFWRRSINSIVWHQAVLPQLISRYNIDVLFVPHNRVPILASCPQVVILHDLAEFHVERKYDAVRSIYRRFALSAGVRRADHIVTVSECSRRDISSILGINNEKITVISNGVGGEYGGLSRSTAGAVLAERYGIVGPYILYVGALEHPNKNLVRLLQAYRDVVTDEAIPHKLILVGPKRWRPEVILDEISRLGLDDQVSWLGYVPQGDLACFYAAADIFVYVSLWEGFGLPVLEAMASGTPVVASATSSIPEIVGNAGCLVDPGNRAEIAAAISGLLGNSDMRKRLSDAGRERAGLFTWKNSADRLLKVFESVAKNGAQYRREGQNTAMQRKG